MGMRTLIVEKAAFPRDKVCGGCVSPSGMDSLRHMGLEQAVRRAAAPIHSFSLTARGRRLGVRLDQQGAAIGRDVLDSLLLDHAAAHGAVVRQNTLATMIEASDHGCRIGLADRDGCEEIAAAVVVVADGLAGSFLPREGRWESRVARGSHFGVGTRLSPGTGGSLCEPGTIAMRCGSAGYFGAVLLNDGSVDVAAALSPETTKRLGGPGAAIRQLAIESGSSEHADLLANARWRGTPLLTRRREVEAPGVFVVGDAAGYVEPFTGEGMSWGLGAGLAVAHHAEASLSRAYQPGIWTTEWKGLANRRRVACRATAIALRSPTLIGVSIRIANAIPAAAHALTSVVSGPWRLNVPERVRA